MNRSSGSCPTGLGKQKLEFRACQGRGALADPHSIQAFQQKPQGPPPQEQGQTEIDQPHWGQHDLPTPPGFQNKKE